jgi:4-hydroxy-tetrahydrodipicolinate synthase
METKRDDIKGIIPPLITPFTKDGIMDEKALRSEIQFMLKSRVDGLSFGGSTGEGALLSVEEIGRGITILKEENHKNVSIICGIISNSTNDAIKKGLAAKKAGADGLMVTPTFYHGTDDAGNIAYYQALSDAVELPIIIYNVIDRNPITPDLMQKISSIKNVIGIKQSVGGLHAVNAMVASCGNNVKVFAAQDDVLFCSYLLGTVGAISAILTVFPELCVEQWEAVQAGDIKKAKEIHSRLYPVWKLVSVAGMSFPGRLKAIIKILGRDAGFPRQPILEPSAEVFEQLRKALMNSNLLPEQ